MNQTKAKVRNQVNLRYNATASNKSMADGRSRTKIWCQPLYIYVIAQKKRAELPRKMISNKKHKRPSILLGPETQPPLAISWSRIRQFIRSCWVLQISSLPTVKIFTERKLICVHPDKIADQSAHKPIEVLLPFIHQKKWWLE